MQTILFVLSIVLLLTDAGNNTNATEIAGRRLLDHFNNFDNYHDDQLARLQRLQQEIDYLHYLEFSDYDMLDPEDELFEANDDPKHRQGIIKVLWRVVSVDRCFVINPETKKVIKPYKYITTTGIGGGESPDNGIYPSADDGRLKTMGSVIYFAETRKGALFKASSRAHVCVMKALVYFRNPKHFEYARESYRDALLAEKEGGMIPYLRAMGFDGITVNNPSGAYGTPSIYGKLGTEPEWGAIDKKQVYVLKVGIPKKKKKIEKPSKELAEYMSALG